MTELQLNLFPCFQPIVSVANGKIIGYEALARQINSNNAVVSAGSLFSSSTLSTEQRTAFDRDVRWKALQKFAELDNNTSLAINISASWIENLRHLNALPTLKMLDDLKIDRHRIIIEISEQHADLVKLTEIVKRYRKQGLRVALDDFGAGASQLQRVMAIQPDIIKIDMRLFKKATKGGIVGEVVSMMTRLGKRTGCQIICEGVETDEEFLFGLNCGAQYMQGHLFSPAQPDFMPADSYEQHIVSLRTKFLKRKIAKIKNKIKSIANTKELIYRLAKQLQGDFNLNELASWNFAESGVIRFYLCDNDGYQLSPDFNFSEDKWFTDPRKIGFNWSWRPYFFQLLALEDSGDRDRIITSERYRDFSTDFLCKTLSLRLDTDRILLVDIVASE
ncbi:EAL domain-containing protein [Methylomonas sp. MgM2]